MTTAARPTFDPQTGQLTKEELENIDLQEELLKAERKHFEKIQGEQLREASAAVNDDSDDDISSDEEEEEDDTVALLLELEKIKKECAEEKERIELENMESAERRLLHFYFLNTTIYITIFQMVLAETIGVARSTNVDESCQAANIYHYQEVLKLYKNKVPLQGHSGFSDVALDALKIAHELSLMQI
ncbi:20380_t:CDS:2 [Gigaspora margarita]|uniref:20380_t:CDS:1 n=1 Tax=Gigaspora margarita TaxID=4874 RepID=A0ABM8W1M7_GIGMA|nr:20380_t:CDS:2 [Gigaspora margarita]